MTVPVKPQAEPRKLDKDAIRAAYRSVPTVRVGAGRTYAAFEEGYRHGLIALESSLDAAVERAERAEKAGERWISERSDVEKSRSELRAERDRYKAALDYLADPQSWGGNPRDQTTPLYGHDTPFELALAALSPEE